MSQPRVAVWEAIRNNRLTPCEKLLAVYLADLMFPAGPADSLRLTVPTGTWSAAHPVGDMAADLGLTVRTVQSAIARLDVLDVIDVTVRPGKPHRIVWRYWA